MTGQQKNHETKKIFGVLLPDWIDEEVLRKLVYSFVGLVMAILVSSLFVWPRFADLYKNEKELDRLEKSLEVLSNSVSQVDDLKTSLGEEEMAVLEMAVPRVFDPGLILSGLKKVSVDAGVSLGAYQVDGGVIEVKKEDGQIKDKDDLVTLKEHKVVLKLVGRADKLISFIDLIDTSLPLSVISDLSLSEISKLLNQQGVSQLEMEIIYFESKLAEIEVDKIVSFTEKNKQLLSEIMLYSKPRAVQSIQNEDGNWIGGGRRSVFGF